MSLDSSRIVYRPDRYDIKEKDFEDVCEVFHWMQSPSSPDARYTLPPNTLIACRERGCRFCYLILKHFTDTGRLPLAFQFWKHEEGNALRVAGDFESNDTGRNLEVYDIYISLGHGPLGFVKSASAPVPDKLPIAHHHAESQGLGAFSWIGTLPDVAEDGRSPKCVERASSWLDQCMREHTNCSAPGIDPSIIPKRIIYVGDSTTPPRLCEFAALPSQNRSYVALSHCWGRVQAYTTTRPTYKDRKRGLPWEDIPKTFQDAIKVVRSLGLQFLWIDSLCIIQDDEGDWAEEAAKMCHIYSNAIVTIVASCASNSRQGFLRKRQHIATLIESPMEKSQLKIRKNLHVHYSKAGPLVDRGWCFQERLLSRRLLMFEEHEMVWRCRDDKQCECSAPLEEARYLDSPRYEDSHSVALTQKEATPSTVYSLALKTTDVKETYAWWHGTVAPYYSALLLTKWTDRFPALSGLATAVGNKTKDTYLAGIWSGELARGLLWRSTERSFSDEYLAPSWSWASVKCRITYTGDIAGGNEFRGFVTFDSHKFEQKTGDPMGALSFGSIRIECPLFKTKARWSLYKKTGSVMQLHFGSYAAQPILSLDTCTELIRIRTLQGIETTVVRCDKPAKFHGDKLLEVCHDLHDRTSKDPDFSDCEVVLAVLGLARPNFPQLKGLILGRSRSDSEVYERVGWWYGNIYKGFMVAVEEKDVREAERVLLDKSQGYVQRITMI